MYSFCSTSGVSRELLRCFLRDIFISNPIHPWLFFLSAQVDITWFLIEARAQSFVCSSS
jgi:hypothetical protein